MNGSIGFHLGTNFVECMAKNGDEILFSRHFLTQHNEWEALRDFIQSLDLSKYSSHVNVSTKWAERIIEKRIGASLAMLVTEGFQNWPTLSQDLKRKRAQRNPKRESAILDPEFIFGLSERTSAQGEILQSPDQQELEFLDAKLKLMGIQNLAICFLHSNQNPENEESIANFFEARGYKVFCSHRISDKNNEVARWWRSVLDTYVAEIFTEQWQTLESLLSEYKLEPKLLDNNGKLANPNTDNYFASSFASTNNLVHHFATKASIVYWGLENFLLIHPEKKNDVYMSQFGPIGVSHWQQDKLCLQPTQVIAPDEWKIFSFLRQELGFDPGPMFLGKSLTPCILDLMYLADHLNDLSSLKNHLNANSKTRIYDALYTFTRESVYEKRLEEFIEKISDIIIKKLATHLRNLSDSSRKLLFTGPLAPIFYKSIQPLLPDIEILLDKNYNHIDAYSCAEHKPEGHNK